MAAALERGARVFKAHVQVGGYDPNDPLLEPVWGLLAESGTPVVVHCGSGPAPGKHTGPGPIGALLGRHPRLRLIVAHLGLPEYADFLDLADRHRSVHLDTTMVFTDFTERTAPFPPAELRAWPRCRAASCSAATSRTSRTATRTRCTPWRGSAWGRTGCARSATTTPPGCSVSRHPAERVQQVPVRGRCGGDGTDGEPVLSVALPGCRP